MKNNPSTKAKTQNVHRDYNSVKNQTNTREEVYKTEGTMLEQVLDQQKPNKELTRNNKMAW